MCGGGGAVDGEIDFTASRRQAHTRKPLEDKPRAVGTGHKRKIEEKYIFGGPLLLVSQLVMLLLGLLLLPLLLLVALLLLLLSLLLLVVVA
jgi:hypothetical protein